MYFFFIYMYMYVYIYIYNCRMCAIQSRSDWCSCVDRSNLCHPCRGKSKGSPMVLKGSHWLLMVPNDFRLQPMISKVSRWLSIVPNGSGWLPMIPKGSRWLLA